MTEAQDKITKTEIGTIVVIVGYLISLFIVMLKELGVIWAK
jgi:hypothetical protein